MSNPETATEIARLRSALKTAEQAMLLHGWQLAIGSDDEGAKEAFAAWEAVDIALHGMDGAP